MNKKTRSQITFTVSILVILFSSIFAIGQTKPSELITSASVGDVKLGMTVGEARKVLKGFTLGPGGGSEGLTFIGVFDGEKQILEFGEYGERDEDGNLPPIDENQIIKYIGILDPRFKTAENIGIGTSVEEIEKHYGKLKEIFFDQHVGEIAYFSNAPKGLDFLLIGKDAKYGEAGNYVGAEPQDYGQRTKKYNPGAYVSSMSISMPPPAQQVVSITGVPENFKIQIYGPKECENDTGTTRYSLWTTTGTITNYQEFDFEDLKPCLGEEDESEEIDVAYDDQYDVFFGDYNFDGKTDIALRDGMNGGYSSASYQVYLFSSADDKFVHSPAFTELAQYQGMFETDDAKKMIFMSGKSGCCFHQTNGYIVENNAPVKVYEQTTDHTAPGATEENPKITTKKLIGGKWQIVPNES